MENMENTHMFTRRRALTLLAAAPAVGVARVQGARAAPITDEDGEAVEHFRIPVELDPAKAPGVIFKGAEGAGGGATVVYEFFDYNCGYCRKAASELEMMLAADRNLRLGLLNNAILSIGSAQAARVQQGVLRLHGPKIAYDFHLRLFARHSSANGDSALDVAREMGLDPKQIEESGDSDAVKHTLTTQAKLAVALNLDVTPAFVVVGTAVPGWPGRNALQRIVANARKCGQFDCAR